MRLLFGLVSMVWLLVGCESTPELAAPLPPMPVNRVLVVPFEGAGLLPTQARDALAARIQADNLPVEGLPADKTPFYTPTALDGGLQAAQAGYDLVLFGRIAAGADGLVSLEAYRPEKNELLFSNVTSLFTPQETHRAVNTLWDGFRSRFPEKLTVVLAGASLPEGAQPLQAPGHVTAQDLPPPPTAAQPPPSEPPAPVAAPTEPPTPVAAAPVAAPKAAAPKVAAAPAAKGFSVQAGAFLERQRAEERAALLKSKGYAAFVAMVRDPVSGRTLHAVRFGDHADRARAEAARKHFQEKEGVPAIISVLPVE